MTSIQQFVDFVKKVNYQDHIPTDNEIRIYMAKNAVRLPHFDASMIEIESGNGKLSSRLNKEVFQVLDKQQGLILKIYHDTFGEIRARPGKVIILPHPFYWLEPDEGEKVKIKMRSSLEL